MQSLSRLQVELYGRRALVRWGPALRLDASFERDNGGFRTNGLSTSGGMILNRFFEKQPLQRRNSLSWHSILFLGGRRRSGGRGRGQRAGRKRPSVQRKKPVGKRNTSHPMEAEPLDKHFDVRTPVLGTTPKIFYFSRCTRPMPEGAEAGRNEVLPARQVSVADQSATPADRTAQADRYASLSRRDSTGRGHLAG